MNNPIAALDSLSLAFLVAAIAWAMTNKRSELGSGARVAIIATLITMILRDFSNVLQWTGVTQFFDQYLEDFIEILIPLFLGFFLYTFLQDKMVTSLKSSAQERQLILDSLSESLMFINRDLNIEWTNKAAEALFERSPNEMIGHKCHSILHNSDIPCDECPVIRAISSGRIEENEVSAFSAKTLHMTAHPVIGPTGRIIGALESVVDISPRKKMEQQLAGASKMEAIGKLAGGVAHDFNNILTAIIGFAECGIEEAQESPTEKQNPQLEALFKNIIESGQRAADLTQQLLAFGRRQILHPRIIDLNEIITGTLNMLSRMIGEDIDLRLNLADGAILLSADRAQIEQVIMNLAVNARDAMPNGGKIEIITQVTETVRNFADDPVHAPPGLYASIIIQDSGKGMEPDVLNKLFDPFFTTKNNGTGLGLSVTYGIVKQHGGWISAYSEKNIGSVFKVYLPMAHHEEPTQDPIMKIPGSVQLDGRGIGILIVEDEARILDFVSTSLTRRNFRVFTAETFSDGLKTFETVQDECQIVLSDVVLPDGSGVDLVEKIWAVKPSLSVILSSGYTEERAGLDRIRSSGFLYLPKPYPLTKLLSTISEAMQTNILNQDTPDVSQKPAIPLSEKKGIDQPVKKGNH
ncbi:MAG: hypothetical protein CVV64_12240 [Candidatus Wallbacteria bacterium HGW-Wallbacteria-1]|jgi:PAS domain S-box-containing protein|uniref:histidine kinase n=1 Tax=Candidatus Wallbacteria bacterium HGW-Wallbacteria-1 TaxID=2013854 RepID=A0A2N1PNL1_9BACT|nr:MAG: hypothetical protein CVV64_12240 [Candidatus Wallbacteria bacterium HGW-Wallbacteria-1]